MRWHRPYPLPFAVLALLAAVAPSPPAALAHEPGPPAAEAAAPAPTFLGDYLAEVDRVREQILALAAAIPQEKYAWRPGEGVRSVSEVYLHIAFANYMLPAVAGYAPPADLADQLGVDKIQAWDTSTTDKAAVADKLSRSFDHLRSTVAGIAEADLEAKVDFFGGTPTKRQLLLLALGHMHEHLGQSIAYARINGIAPPWSAAQQEAMQEAQKAAGGGEGE
jgi:uncharacterized damage-inducible protein DinB